MEITEVRIKLVSQRQAYEDRLRAFCTLTLDDAFVVRDLKIIEGQNGYFVAMPSRKLTARCPRCNGKNHLRARNCNDCGAHLKPVRAGPGDRPRYHADIAHPINAEMRGRLEQAVVQAYESELEQSKRPGYVPQEFPDLDYDEPSAEAHA